MRTFILLTYAMFGCSTHDAPDTLAPIDTPAADPETDIPPDTDPAGPPPTVNWTVAVWPPLPAYDDDLSCFAFGLPLDAVLEVTWTVNEQPWAGTSAIVPHLEQAGGQRWACTVTLPDGERRASAPVVIEPPVAMAELPPGEYHDSMWLRYVGADPETVVTLTRPFLMSVTEVTNEVFFETVGYLPELLVSALDDNSTTPLATYPVFRLQYREAAAFANAVSRLDGLPECFTCTGSGQDVQCDVVGDPAIFDCPGYRLPSVAEWEYAYFSAGQLRDMLPAGGSWQEPPGDPYVYDVEVTGPNAPPNSMLSDQCFFNSFQAVYDGQPTGPAGATRFPSRQGVYDLCGNASEILLDAGRDTIPRLPIVDPFPSRPGPGRAHSAYGDPENAWPLSFGGGVDDFAGGIRLVRTNTPLGAAP